MRVDPLGIQSFGITAVRPLKFLGTELGFLWTCPPETADINPCREPGLKDDLHVFVRAELEIRLW
jgi:hypothetical protein